MNMKSVYAALVGLALLCAPVGAQVLVTLSPSPVLQFINANGTPASGGEVFVYAAGTTTKITTYIDSTGATPNTNPIILNTLGDANIWIQPGIAYKYVLAPPGSSDPPTAPIWTVDNISLVSTSVASTTNLQNTARSSVPTGIILRVDYAPGEGAPPLWFLSETGTCSSNGHVNDGGSCVDAIDGNSWVADFPSSGLSVADFGVSPSQTATFNSTQLSAAAVAAYSYGLRMSLCISGSNAVIIPTNGSPLYGSPNAPPVFSCATTTYKMMTTGAAFFTLPSTSSSTPGENWQTALVIDNLNVDMNNNHGTAVLLQGFRAVVLNNFVSHNVGTTTWSYDDGVATGLYNDAAITVKGISSVAGPYYVRINNPLLLQPGATGTGGAPITITGGVGILQTITVGDTSTRPNVTTVTGGRITGFTYGGLTQAGGDLTVNNTDLSENTYAWQVGDPANYSGFSIPRATFNRPYLESVPTAPMIMGIHFMSNASTGVVNGTASTSGTIAPCVDDGTSRNFCNPRAGSYVPGFSSRFGVGTTTYSGGGPGGSANTGYYEVWVVGGGGGGGASTATTASNAGSAGGGGGAGGVAHALCYDPLGVNFPFTVVGGAAGAAGTSGGAGGTGGTSSITGDLSGAPDWTASNPYSIGAVVMPTLNNSNNDVFKALTAGTSGGSEPTWTQSVLSSDTDGGVIWYNLGPQIVLTANGGVGGSAGGGATGTTDVELGGAGGTATSTQSMSIGGCQAQDNSDGLPGNSGGNSFFASSIGISGSGANSLFGSGGAGVLNGAGNSGAGSGTGGSGGLSMGAAASAHNGGAGQGGFILFNPQAAASQGND